MQINPNFKRVVKLAWAVIKGFFWPVTIAACIVIYGAFAPWQPPAELKKAVGTFFAVLFFIMFFFGQYKRVEKQTDDKDSFQALNDHLISLEELVRNIPPSQSEVPPSSNAASDSGSLLEEAQGLLASGHSLAALLVGGVAFEHSVRAFARHFKGEEAARLPLHDLMTRVSPQEMAKELHALRQIRNRITHISEVELSDLPDPERVLSGYQWAVESLAEFVSRDSAAKVS